MKDFLIFDGPSQQGIELNEREQRFSKILTSISPELCLKSIPHESFLESLNAASASVCLLHHSELRHEIETTDLPTQHFYVHYSGAGFAAAKIPWANSSNHLFFGDSIDDKDLHRHDGFLNLIKALAAMTTTHTPEHWKPQLKTISLVPYLNQNSNLCSHFPKQLAEAFLLGRGANGHRESFSRWAKEMPLSDGSSPGPLTIETAWQFYTKHWRAHQSQTSSSDVGSSVNSQPTKSFTEQQQNLSLAHDCKHLLFSLKTKDYDQLARDWESFDQNHLKVWRAKHSTLEEDIELGKIPSWIREKNETALLKAFKNLRDMLKSRADQEQNLEDSSVHSKTILPSYKELKHPATAHSPIVWSVGPNESYFQEFYEKLSLQTHHKSDVTGPQRFAHDNISHLIDLLQHLRFMTCQEVFHTLLVIDVGANLKETLNAGHKAQHHSLSAKWTHDQNLQLGLLTCLVLTFPHVSMVVLHQHEPAELKEILHQELLLTVPDNTFSSQGNTKDSFIDHLIQHHFFNKTPTPETLQRFQLTCLNFFEGKRTLFDPTGLRTLFKCRLIANIFSGTSKNGHPELKHTETQRTVLCSRLKNLLVSVDEDNNSTLFHAYAGYRYGYRAWTITSFHQFDDESIWRSPSEHKLVLRDTDLRFPDIDGREPLRGQQKSGELNVRQRLESIFSDLWQYLPNPEEAAVSPKENPILQNAGKNTPKVDESWVVRVIAAGGSNIRTKPWIGASPEERQWGEVRNTKDPAYLLGLRKPLTSLFDLSALMPKKDKQKVMTVASQLVPPERLKSRQGHYAPYINLPIASELLDQAKTLKDDDELDWLLGAILALEADEILLGMSEYTGLDAVRFLHRCEVKAEIRSVGFSGMIRIKPRKQELNHLVRTRYANDELSQDHFLSRLWDDLRTLYKSAEQFHAAEEANIEGFCKRKWLTGTRALHPIEELLRRSFILSASSIWMWSASLCFSTLILWFLYSNFLPTSVHGPLGFQILISSLIGEPALGLELLTPKNMSLGLRITMLLHYGTSYILFGFFLSMIYRRITRS